MTAIRILILSFLIPAQFNLYIGSLYITPYRFVLLALAPYVFWLIIKKYHKTNWNLCDLFASAIFIWPIVAFSVNTSLAAGIESGGILTLETSVRKAFSKLMFLIVAILFLVGLPESITGRYFIREFAGNITGNIRDIFAAEQRLGIWRAVGPTDHPILFGTVCSSITAVVIAMAMRRARYWLILICSIGGAVLSASSAPILSLMAQFGLIIWAFTFKTVKNKWWLFFICFAIGYIAIDFLSNRNPIQVMFTYLLINPSTGYARYYMWINSFIVVAQSHLGMIFGYGYDNSIFDVITNSYQRILMQHTVDSFWLVQMLRYGTTILIFYTLFLFFTFKRTATQIKHIPEKKDKRLLQAWMFSAIAMTLIATTVHFWNQMSSIYMMVLAICVSGASQHGKRKKRSSAHTKSLSALPKSS